MSSYQPGSKFILHVDLDNDSDMICHEKGGFGIKIAIGLLVHVPHLSYKRFILWNKSYCFRSNCQEQYVKV